MAVKYGQTNKGAKRSAPKTPDKTIVGKEAARSSEESLYAHIDSKVQDSIGFTATWEDNQDKWHKLRMRIKKTKTFPFVGSSNIRMPTAEIQIRKVKAGLMGIIFGMRPICQVIPTPSGNWQTAQKIEKLLDHLAMEIIGIEQKAEISIDRALEKGFFLNKPYWRKEIIARKETVDLEKVNEQEKALLFNPSIPREQLVTGVIQKYEIDMDDNVAEENIAAVNKAVEELLGGKTKVEMELQEVTYDFPDVALIEPERCYVPTDSGYHPQGVRWLVHEFFLPIDTVKRNAKYKYWSEAAVKEIGESESMDLKQIEQTKETREGIERIQNSSHLVKIWEYYGWYDLDGDGIEEKVVVTLAPEFKKVLKKMLLPFNSGKFPFVKFYYELNDDRWFHHRGIPEMLEDIIKEIDVQHNMKIDSQTIRNAPMIVYRAGMINPNLVQMIPNQGIPVSGLQPLDDTISVLNLHNPNTEYSYEREQMILETKIQEMVGQIDFSLQSMINRRQPRTLGEVQMQQQQNNSVFALDSKHFVQQFSELFTQIWELWSQYGRDDYEFNYFGQKSGGERVRLTKEEIQGKYTIAIRGNDQNTNPEIKVQKAQQILMAITNPVFLQMGVVNPINIAQGLRRFYQALDVPNWEELISPNPQPVQPPPGSNIQVNFEDMTDGEQAQVLANQGLKPDIQGRMLNEKSRRSELETDQLIELAKIRSKKAEAPKSPKAKQPAK